MKIQIKVSTEFILDAQTYSGDGEKKKKNPENLIFEILQLPTRNKTNFQNWKSIRIAQRHGNLALCSFLMPLTSDF